MSNISIKKNRNNDTLLQEIKNHLFGKKNKKELNYYTVLDFKNKDDFVKSQKKSSEIIKKNLKRINKKHPSDDNYTNKGLKKEGLSFIIGLRNGAQSYLANLQQEEAFKKNNDINKITEDKGSNLYRFKRTLDYIKKVEEYLGFSLEQTPEKTIDKFILIRNVDKLERKFEKKIKKFNRKHPFSLKSINDYVQQEGLLFIIESKQQAISYIKGKEEHAAKGNDHYDDVQINLDKIKQDKKSLLYQYQLMLDYINLMEKKLGLNIESNNFLSKIREDSVKILSNSNLRSVYDEGVASKELNSSASYEDCIKYQQKVNERDSSVEKSEAIVKKANDQQQVNLKSNKKVEKALVVKYVGISYSPSISVNTPKPEKMSSTTQSFKQVVQNPNNNTVSNLHIVQKQKRLSLNNTMTLLLSVYGEPISSIFGMKNLQMSIVTRFNWPNLNVSMGISSIKALPQEKLTSETSQSVQQQDNKKESNNSFSTFSNIKNWCYYNIVEPVVNFVGVTLEYNALNSNLSTDYKSDIESGVSGKYTKTPDNITSSADNEQKVGSELHGVTIQKLLTTIKCIG
ncbi:hypothetical protein [Candidatus Mesenet endosymbiont of Agriotes lineatus]|uniref:hypothetical protein n=1 Tax=Candidatus Mesenet endosymbiont of Agriotes lineatus TaxID=3077948 RepID=UPI0030D479F0